MCVCVFITCYNLHSRFKIKQSPPQQNPVYNTKPWENPLHLWPVQKDPYPHPSHFCWTSFWLMKTRCRQTHLAKSCLTHRRVQEAQNFTGALLCPVCKCQPASVTPSCTHPPECCLSLEDPPVVYCGAPGDWQLTMVGHSAGRNLAHSCYSCSSTFCL